MQVAQSIQVLPAVTDQANLYVGLNVLSNGLTSKTFSSPGLVFNPSGNLLTVANISVSNSLKVNNTNISSDPTSGAMVLVPAPTATYANPVGLVIGPTGAISTVVSAGGVASATAINASATAAIASGGIASAVKVYNFISTVTVGTGTVRWYPQTGVTLVSCYLTAGTAPSLGSFTATLKKNGTAVATLSLTSGSYNSSTTTLSVTATTSDYFTVDVGSSGGATDGTLTITYLKT
jgi:hypothetical protein